MTTSPITAQVSTRPASSEAATRYSIRTAEPADVSGIQSLLENFSSHGLLLPRSSSDLYNSLHGFRVIQHQGKIIACAALQIFTDQLGEVRSLAVAKQHSKHGLGLQLVRRIEQEAQGAGLSRLMALTYVPTFFHKLGFHTVDIKELPEKVWGVCINCYKFHNCDETAVLKYI